MLNLPCSKREKYKCFYTNTGVVNNIQDIFNNLLSFRYTWRKNGKPYDWQVYDDRISQQPGRGTLVITSPRDEDIGMYFFI